MRTGQRDLDRRIDALTAVDTQVSGAAWTTWQLDAQEVREGRAGLEVQRLLVASG